MRFALPSCLLLVVAAALAPTRDAAAQLVHGVVTDATSGAPVADARLYLLDLDGGIVAGTNSDEGGAFELRPRVGGAYQVSVERLGYTAFRSEIVSVGESGTVEVRIRLGVDAIPLSPFVVLADSEIPRGRLMDFEQRRRDPSIFGHFLGAEDIRARPIAKPTQLLRTLPSVELIQVQTQDNPMGLDRNLVYLPGSRGGSLVTGMCLAQVFVNGIPMRQSQTGSVTVDDLLDGVTIVGVELYTRASSAPLQFRGTGECGVVLYWTEEPPPSTGGWSLKRIAVGVGLIAGVLFAGFIG